jgi:hypothetical protein
VNGIGVHLQGFIIREGSGGDVGSIKLYTSPVAMEIERSVLFSSDGHQVGQLCMKFIGLDGTGKYLNY